MAKNKVSARQRKRAKRKIRFKVDQHKIIL